MGKNKFLTIAEFQKLLKASPTFDDFLQNLANFAIERFAKVGYNPPEGRLEALIDAVGAVESVRSLYE